jgi:hypothetical protein
MKSNSSKKIVGEFSVAMQKTSVVEGWRTRFWHTFFFGGNPVPKLIDATPDLSCPRQRFKRRCQTRIQDIDGFVHKICQSKTSSFIRKFSAQ